jgi:beta-phosphoglucomutase-like phosphatase (HAD superfamily)
MIEAVIFDMDGLLIDSEPLWRKAEKEVFGQVGMMLVDEMCFETVGLRIDEVVQHWYDRHPWDNMTLKEVELAIVDRMAELIAADGQPLEGVFDIISYFEQQNLKLAVASSSNLRLIEAVLHKFDIYNRFEVVHSAEFESYGKPHPSVFITAAKQLGVAPTNCLVFEDSIGGMTAAKAARMVCVVVPEAIHSGLPQFGLSNLILTSLLDFTPDHLNQLNANL